MARILADVTFVGVWKATTRIKDVIFNNSKLQFPEQITKIISISNTQAGTIFIVGQPSPDAKGFPATKVGDRAVEFLFKVQSDKYYLKEIMLVKILDNANLIGESVQEWSLPGQSVVAKLITKTDYHRIGRMKS